MLSLGIVVLSFIAGIFCTLIVLSALIYKLFLKCPTIGTASHEPSFDSCVLPQELLSTIKGSSWQKQKFPCLTENLIFHFLFREWKDTPQLRRWLMKKLHVEFLEIQKTLTGRFLEHITVRDLQLGTNVPVFKSVSIENVVLHEKKNTLEEVTLCLDLEYAGGFQLAVDVTVLGRKAYLSVRVTRLKGIAKLQLTRRPYSHWSFTFKENPDVDFAVESHFQGRTVPQLTSVIVTQIRKSLRKKHTFPNYKMRFKPFIPAPDLSLLSTPSSASADESEEHNAEGLLVVTVIECSRLFLTNQGGPFTYCSIAVDSTAWVEMTCSEGSSWCTHDIEIAKQKNERIGITFREEENEITKKNMVFVETIQPSSPACTSGVKKNDILISVNGIKVLNVKHAAKLLKQVGAKFYMRIRRKTSNVTSETPEILKEFETFLDKDSGEDFGFVAISRKEAPVKNGNNVESKPERPCNFQGDVDKLFDTSKSEGIVLEASSTPNTPKKEFQGSVKSSLQGSLPDLRIGEGDSESSINVTEAPADEVRKSSCAPRKESAQDIMHLAKAVSVQKTSMVRTCEDPVWKENLIFQFGGIHRYLNVGVWCRDSESDSNLNEEAHCCGSLLGHVSIPLLPVLEECSSTSQGFHMQTFKLLPPDMAGNNKSPFEYLASHSGFDERLCYGDVTLAFTLKEKPSKLDIKRSSIGKHEPEEPQATKSKIPSAAIKKKASQFISACQHKKHVIDGEFPTESEDELLLVDTGLSANHISEGGPFGRNHVFSSTRFQSATVCHYCKKKIWLKVAFQCQVCEMICHKKCMSRCQAKFACLGESEEAWPASQEGSVISESVDPVELPPPPAEKGRKEIGLFQRKSFSPLITTIGTKSMSHSTAGTDPPPPDSMKMRRKGLQNFFSNLAGSGQGAAPLNRAGSDHNLSLPSNQLSVSSSKSLPPSPQHSPAQSRKSSLQGNQVNWFNALSLEDQDINKVIEGLLAMPQDEAVLSLAKERGKELYNEFAAQERKEKLNAMITKLQEAIDSEVETRLELSKEDQKITNPNHKTRLAFKIGKCDERMQALSVLMLHYFSGLQHCLDCEGAEKTRQEDQTSSNAGTSCDQETSSFMQKADDIPFLCVQAPPEDDPKMEETEMVESKSHDSLDPLDPEVTDIWSVGDAPVCIESDTSSESSYLELPGSEHEAGRVEKEKDLPTKRIEM